MKSRMVMNRCCCGSFTQNTSGDGWLLSAWSAVDVYQSPYFGSLASLPLVSTFALTETGGCKNGTNFIRMAGTDIIGDTRPFGIAFDFNPPQNHGAFGFEHHVILHDRGSAFGSARYRLVLYKYRLPISIPFSDATLTDVNALKLLRQIPPGVTIRNTIPVEYSVVSPPQTVPPVTRIGFTDLTGGDVNNFSGVGDARFRFIYADKNEEVGSAGSAQFIEVSTASSYVDSGIEYYDFDWQTLLQSASTTKATIDSEVADSAGVEDANWSLLLDPHWTPTGVTDSDISAVTWSTDGQTLRVRELATFAGVNGVPAVYGTQFVPFALEWEYST